MAYVVIAPFDDAMLPRLLPPPHQHTQRDLLKIPASRRLCADMDRCRAGPYIVTALYSHGLIQLWPYIVMACIAATIVQTWTGVQTCATTCVSTLVSRLRRIGTICVEACVQTCAQMRERTCGAEPCECVAVHPDNFFFGCTHAGTRTEMCHRYACMPACRRASC